MYEVSWLGLNLFVFILISVTSCSDADLASLPEPHFKNQYKKSYRNDDENYYEKKKAKPKKYKSNNYEHVSNKNKHDFELHEDYKDLSDDVQVNKIEKKKVLEPQSEMVQRKWNFYETMSKLDLQSVPASNDSVLMARYIVHNVDWAAIATISSQPGSKNNPFANVKSISDGPVELGSGIPFFYLSPMDLSAQDLTRDNRISVTVTLAQTNYCRTASLDPQDPRCGRLVLNGKLKRIKSNTAEEDFAEYALFTRHPVMKTWPTDHNFYFAKLKIAQVLLLDNFGGFKSIDVDDYLNGRNDSSLRNK